LIDKLTGTHIALKNASYMDKNLDGRISYDLSMTPLATLENTTSLVPSIGFDITGPAVAVDLGASVFQEGIGIGSEGFTTEVFDENGVFTPPILYKSDRLETKIPVLHNKFPLNYESQTASDSFNAPPNTLMSAIAEAKEVFDPVIEAVAPQVLTI